MQMAKQLPATTTTTALPLRALLLRVLLLLPLELPPLELPLELPMEVTTKEMAKCALSICHKYSKLTSFRVAMAMARTTVAAHG